VAAVVVGAVAVVAAVAVIVGTAATAAGSVVGTAVAEIAAERIAGKNREARLETWYGDSERPWSS
jgi:hypothetical protein